MGIVLWLIKHNNKSQHSKERIKDEKKIEKLTPVTSPVSVNIHHTTNNTSNLRDKMNNFDQKYSTINAGVQGENSGVSNQQNFQNNTCTPEDKQKIKEIAHEIKRILEKIDSKMPNATNKQKQDIVSYEISPEKRNKAVRVLKAGGEEALKEFLDNPYLNIAMAIVKEWRNEE